MDLLNIGVESTLYYLLFPSIYSSFFKTNEANIFLYASNTLQMQYLGVSMSNLQNTFSELANKLACSTFLDIYKEK